MSFASRALERSLETLGLARFGTLEMFRHRLKKAEQAVAKAEQAARDRVLDNEKRHQKNVQVIRAMQSRLVEIERDTADVRESLMVMEVKLDVIEGALTVLDRRTRGTGSPPTGSAPAPTPAEPAARAPPDGPSGD